MSDVTMYNLLHSPSQGAQHASIEEAFEDADADGTRSILDLDHFSEQPDFGAMTPLPIYFVRRGVKR